MAFSLNNDYSQSIDRIHFLIENPGIQDEVFERNVVILQFNLERLVDDFISGKLDSVKYDKLKERIKELDSRYGQTNEKIHSMALCIVKCITRTPYPSPARDQSPSYYERVYSGAVFAVSTTVSLVKDYMYDFDHPWKQKKYALGMKLLQDSIQTGSWNLQEWQDRLRISSVEDRLSADMEKVIHALLAKVDVEGGGSRDQFKQFLLNLRNLLTSPLYKEERQKQSNEIVNLALDLCYSRFADVQIFSFSHSVMQMLFASGRQKLKSRKGSSAEQLPLSKRIELEFKEIENAPVQAPKASTTKNKFKGSCNLGFDPHAGTNMPNALYTLSLTSEDTIRKIRAIRIGTPTQQRDSYERFTYQGEAYINPEFENFIWALTHCKHQKILHLSLQDDVERMVMTESERSIALRGLHAAYPNNFLLVILSQDSNFYYQIGDFASINSAKRFKEQFLEHMVFKDTTGYFFPTVWKSDPQFIKEIEQSIAVVHKDVFGGKDTLTVEERKDFIEIVYARLTLMILKYVQPDFFCFCCKDSVDRAAKCNALLYYIFLLMTNQEKKPEQLDVLTVYLHSPAMLVKKQAMHRERRERFLSALKRLEDPVVQANLRKWRDYFPMEEGIEVVRLEGQEVEF